MRTYDYPQAPFFITQEPGNLTQAYAMLYGHNVTAIMKIVRYLLVPVLFIFWFVVVWFKLKRSNGEEATSSAPTSYPWE